jgi:hypothetical protein
MAETKRMTAEQVVSYLLEEEGLDYLRESLTWAASARRRLGARARPMTPTRRPGARASEPRPGNGLRRVQRGRRRPSQPP